MKIEFYKNNSPKNKVGKTLSKVVELNGTLKDGADIINPSITVHDINSATCNYMYIPNFNRYYFITDVKNVRNGLWVVNAHVDVLETYKNTIKGQTAIVSRQENNWNMFLNDNNFKTQQNSDIITKEFPSGFSGRSFVLAVSGS